MPQKNKGFSFCSVATLLWALASLRRSPVQDNTMAFSLPTAPDVIAFFLVRFETADRASRGLFSAVVCVSLIARFLPLQFFSFFRCLPPMAYDLVLFAYGGTQSA